MFYKPETTALPSGVFFCGFKGACRIDTFRRGHLHRESSCWQFLVMQWSHDAWCGSSFARGLASRFSACRAVGDGCSHALCRRGGVHGADGGHGLGVRETVWRGSVVDEEWEEEGGESLYRSLDRSRGSRRPKLEGIASCDRGEQMRYLC